MTFLEMCQRASRGLNIGGSLSSVEDQVGIFLKLIQFVAQADYDIQMEYTNWLFLQAEFDFSLVPGQAEYSPPDLLRMYDENSFWYKAGTEDATPIPFVSYKEWRDLRRHSFIDDDFPSFVTINPDRSLRLIPAPSTDYQDEKVTCDYWKKPVRLVNNNDVSSIPEEYVETVINLARVYFAENRHDTGWYNSAFIAYSKGMRVLKAEQLPGWNDDNKSESSAPLIIEVL